MFSNESMVKENTVGLENMKEQIRAYKPHKVSYPPTIFSRKAQWLRVLIGGNPITLIKAEKNIRATYPTESQ